MARATKTPVGSMTYSFFGGVFLVVVRPVSAPTTEQLD
jgi:hypothetical protein